MTRDFLNNSFVIAATKPIQAGAELRHVYKSKGWRSCFKVLNAESAEAPATEEATAGEATEAE